MTATQMLYFKTICENPSVTQAANSLGVSQPALSNAIRDLENEFGIDLFYRRSKRFVLTKEGEYFLEKVIPFLDEFTGLNDMMMSLGNSRNSIKLGISPYISGSVLPSLINNFHKSYPEINFDVNELPVHLISQRMANGLLDIAIVNTRTISSSEFEIIDLCTTETVFCVNKNSPLAALAEIDFQTIGQMPVILGTAPAGTSRIKAGFANAGLTPNVLLQTDQIHTILEYVRLGLAAGFLYHEATYPDIVQIPIKGFSPINIGLIFRKNSRIYADTAKFIQFIKDGVETGTLFES